MCHSKQVSVHEMCKRQQVSEDARKMCRTKVVDKRHKTQVQKMEKVAHGRTRHGKESGQAGRRFDLVQKMLGLCATENGAESRMREDGKSKGKQEGLPERNINHWGRILRLEVSCLTTGYGILSRRECWKIEELH